MSSGQEMQAVIERIETLVDTFAGSPDAATQRNARELVQLLMRLYGAGLMRILQIVELHEGPAGRTMEGLLADDLVASLLVLHDLHPEDVETRIRRSLERLQDPVGAILTLLEVRDGTARVKVEDQRGSASQIDLRRLIDGVIRAVAPDIALVNLEGLPAPGSPPLVQLRRPPVTDGVAELPLR